VGTLARARTSSLGFEVLAILKVEERVLLRTGHDDDGATSTAITAVRSAAWHELLPAKRRRAAPTISGFHPQFGGIKEHWNLRFGLTAEFYHGPLME
jgi:hypothetical protein